MCGIWLYKGDNYNDYKEYWKKIKHRGPENTHIKTVKNTTIVFHRLCIHDKTCNGNQPFIVDDNVLICNGEIYNYKQLIFDYDLKVKSNSDCEVILHLFNKFKTNLLHVLDGVYAFVIYNADSLIIARDPIGVRPLFIGRTNKGEFCLSSEAKAIPNNFICEQITPGVLHFIHKNTETIIPRYMYKYIPKYDSLVSIEQRTQYTLIKSVIKRLESDREIGLFLSGGLDSSLIASIAVRHIKTDKKIKSFCIGLEGGEDLKYAKQVAEYIGTDHHEIIFTKDEAFNAINDVIYAIESYDITTIRASTGQYLLSKYIATNTDVKVLLSGEGADEICQGYKYFHFSPSIDDSFADSIRLLEELCFYDVLRTDRTTSAFGLEVRVPFLDPEFIQMYMEIPNVYKSPMLKDKKYIEKYTLRKSFENTGLLPKNVLWRNKEAFSDYSNKDGELWHNIISDKINSVVSDEIFNELKKEYPSKEAYYYRMIFDKYYPGRKDLIPHYWMPTWNKNNDNIIDPSAKIL